MSPAAIIAIAIILALLGVVLWGYGRAVKADEETREE